MGDLWKGIVWRVECMLEAGIVVNTREIYWEMVRIKDKAAKQEVLPSELAAFVKAIGRESTGNENNRRAYVLARKESEQSVKDTEDNSVKKTEGNSVGDVERVAYVFARKESNEAREEVCSAARLKMKDHGGEEANQVIRSEDHGKEEVNEEAKGEVVAVVKDHDEDEARGEARPMVRDRDVENKEEIIAGKLKGGKRSRSSATDEKEIAVFTYKEYKKELGRVEKADPEVVENEEAVDQQKRKACLLREDCSTVGVGEGSNWDIEGGETVKIKVVCEIFKEEFNGEKTGMAENCSTVGVQAGNNVHKGGEAVKPDVVREAPKEEVLKEKDIVLKIEKKPIKFDLAGVIEVENAEKIWDKDASNFNRKPRTSGKFNVGEDILAISQTGKESDMENGDLGDNMKYRSPQNKSKEQNCEIDNVVDQLVKCLQKNQQLKDQVKVFKRQSKNLKLESKKLISIEAKRKANPRKRMEIVEKEKIELSIHNKRLPGSSLVNNESRDESIESIVHDVTDSAVGGTSEDTEAIVKDILWDMVQNISGTSDLLDSGLQKDGTVDTAKLMDDKLTTVKFNKVKTAKDIEVIQVKVSGDKYIKAKKPSRDKSKDEADESTPVKIDLQSFKFSQTVNNSPAASKSKFGLDTKKYRKKYCGLRNLVKQQSKVRKPLLIEEADNKKGSGAKNALSSFRFVKSSSKKETLNELKKKSGENCKDFREQGNDPKTSDSKCFANRFSFNIFARNYARSKYVKVKVDETDVEFVKVTDAPNAKNTTDSRENDEIRAGVCQAMKYGADAVKSVIPGFRSYTQNVEKAEVFAAESGVSRSTVRAKVMYRLEYGADRHTYSEIYEADSGMGAGDLKQLGRLNVVERGSPLEQLLTDVSQVEEPDGLTSAMDPVQTKKYKADKHMYRKKYRVDNGQGAKVLEQPGRLDIAERDGQSQRSFTGVSWVEEPSKLGQQDMQLARTTYDENQAGMVQEESRDS